MMGGKRAPTSASTVTENGLPWPFIDGQGANFVAITPLALSMRETTINMIDALRGQQEQLKRLLAQKALISDAPRRDLSEIEAQVIEIKRLLAEFEKVIQDQLQRGQ
jgi:hypothetical protein